MKHRSAMFVGLCLVVILGSLIWAISPDLQIFASPNRIGVIEVRGLIDDVQDTLKSIKKFRQDPNTRAILVRIESPGGGVGPSQEVFKELRRTVPEKPVVASLGAVAASGGYYIAAAANRIVANPGTVTGSIGVIVYFPNLQGLFEKIGYDMVSLKSGRFKDVGNPSREMTPEEKALLQKTIDQVHRQFIQDVAQGRNLPQEKVTEIADGRLLTGESAQQLGLVDELGNYEDAVKAATELGKIQGEPELIHVKKKRRSLLDYLLGNEMSDRVSTFFGSPWNFLRYQTPLFP